MEYRGDDDDPNETASIVIAPQLYHDNALEVEDNTTKGQQAVKQMRQDAKEPS